MPDRRMIHRKAATSSDLADLREAHGSDAVSFFLLLIPFYDRYGCVPSDARALRGMVCPLWEDVTSADIKRWTAWLVKRGMLVRVTGPNGAKGLRNPHFEEHQAGAKLEREAPSVYEPPKVTKALTRDDRKTANSGVVRTKAGTRSGPGPKAVRVKKEGRKESSPELSPSPPPPTVESAAAPPEPSPGAQAPPPEANGQGHDVSDRVDRDAVIAAAISPKIRKGIDDERQLKEAGRQAARRRRSAAGGGR